MKSVSIKVNQLFYGLAWLTTAFKAFGLSGVLTRSAHAGRRLKVRRCLLWDGSEMNRPGRQRKVHLQICEGFHDVQINGLLHVHIDVVTRIENDIDGFKFEGALPKIFEVRPVESRVFLNSDDLLYSFRHFLYLLNRGVIGQPETENDPSLLEPLVVLDGAANHLSVGHDDLLATQAANTRGLETYMLDSARQRTYDDEVADLEGLIYRDGQ